METFIFCAVQQSTFWVLYINPFVPNAPFFYPLKTSENGFLMILGGREMVDWEQTG